MKKLTLIVISLGVFICLAVPFFLSNDDVSVESSSQIIMASPDEKEQIGNVAVPLLRSKDEQELVVNVAPFEPNTVSGSKEYSDNWCLEQELTADGKRMANEILEEWMSKRGYPGPEEFVTFDAYSDLRHSTPDHISDEFRWPPPPPTTDYDSYGIDTLKRLGASGDFKALRQLVDHPEISDADKQWGYYESYVFGGSHLLAFHVIDLMYDAERAVIRSPDDKTIALSKEKWVRALAWGQFAFLRGDFSGYDAMDNMLFGHFDHPDQFQRKIIITKEDLVRADEMAIQFLVDINNERTRRGMSHLVSDVPKLWKFSYNRKYAASLAHGRNSAWAENIPPSESECFDKMVASYTSRNTQ